MNSTFYSWRQYIKVLLSSIEIIHPENPDNYGDLPG